MRRWWLGVLLLQLGFFGAWTALKGAGTVVVSPGGEWWINASGNPGLATAGTGDVLTGFVASLLAQGIDPGPALRCAVHLHGAAADVVVAGWGGRLGRSCHWTGHQQGEAPR